MERTPVAGNETILVVDDERGSRESLRVILEPRYDVVQARSGSEALEVLRTRGVDVVTLDLDMPGMRGEDVMRHLHDEFPAVEVIVITGCGTVESASQGIRYGISDFIQKPFDAAEVSAAVSHAMERRRSRDRLADFAQVLGSVVGGEEEAEALLAGTRRGRARTLDFLEVLAETVETKDRFMRGHSRRVSFYAGLIAHRLGLSAKDHEHVRISAFLHDLGKVGVPTDLLLSPAPLDPGEREIVQRHPEIGARLLEPLGLAPEIGAGLLYHHEWWDGAGYPKGLAGEEIPLVARVVSVADAFDAMTSDRPYRAAVPRYEVVQELRRFSGSQFDPALVKEFLVILETGVCELDPELIADAVTQATALPEPEPMVKN